METGITQLNVNRFLSSIPANVEVGKIQGHRSDLKGLRLFENQDVNTLFKDAEKSDQTARYRCDSIH